MLNKEKLEQLLAILGDLTEEQKAIVAETLKGSISEKELFGKLGVDEGKFAEFMQALAAQTEDAVLGQELSADEMEAASGGARDGCDSTQYECTQNYRRPRFMGCAATVESGSRCDTNDACTLFAVVYYDVG